MTQHPKGNGLGLRREILTDLQQHPLAEVDFFELAPENWLTLGGRFARDLKAMRERKPFTCHGLSLSLGGTDPLDETLLQHIKQFLDDYDIALYTEHLSWCAKDGQLYDLLPIPFTDEAVNWVAGRIRRAQEILERQIGIENASYYFAPGQATLTEAQFINAVVGEADCFLHLDINNLYVNSQNLGYNAQAFLKQLAPEQVGYLHVAGHFVEDDGWIIDTHGADVIDPVWALLHDCYQWLGPRSRDIPTCLERDFNFPDVVELVREVAKIGEIKNCALTEPAEATRCPPK